MLVTVLLLLNFANCSLFLGTICECFLSNMKAAGTDRDGSSSLLERKVVKVNRSRQELIVSTPFRWIRLGMPPRWRKVPQHGR